MAKGILNMLLSVDHDTETCYLKYSLIMVWKIVSSRPYSDLIYFSLFSFQCEFSHLFAILNDVAYFSVSCDLALQLYKCMSSYVVCR